MVKTRPKRIPLNVYDRVGRMGDSLGIPITKAFVIQDKFLLGDFKIMNIKKKRNGKKIFELEFDL